MKAIACIAALVAALSLPPALYATTDAPAMMDPLLGLYYDPDLNHFEVFPATPPMRQVLGDDFIRWIYASYSAGGTQYYILSGFHPGRRTAGEAPLEPDFGSVARVTGGRLELLGPPDVLFQPKPPVPAEVIEGLLRDAASRYAAAFDGADKLSRAARAQSIADNQYSPVLVSHMATVGLRLKPTAARP